MKIFGITVATLILMAGLGLMLPQVSAVSDFFLVMDDPGCTTTAIATDAGCWSASSGGVGGAGIPGPSDRALFDGASGVGPGNINANMNVLDWCMASACTGGGGNFAGTLNLLASIYIQRNWNSNGGTLVIGTSTVVFGDVGTITTKNNGAYGVKDFYNVAINTSAIMTFTTPVGIANILWINGTLIASNGNPQLGFNVFGVGGSANPVRVGVSSDLSNSGYFFYSVEADVNFNVAGTTYQHLGIRGSPDRHARLEGDIDTPMCGVFDECSIIISTIVPTTMFTLYTDGFDITSGGNFWIGDGQNFPATIFASNSIIEAYGINPTGPGFMYWENATLIAHPSTGVLPFFFAYYQTAGSVAYLQNASLSTTDGEIHLFDDTTLFVNSSTIRFVNLTVAGHLWKDGIDFDQLQISSFPGFMDLISVIEDSRPGRFEFVISVSDPDAGVYFSIGNFTVGVEYTLNRNNIRVGISISNNLETVKYNITGGWSGGSKVIVIQPSPRTQILVHMINALYILGFITVLILFFILVFGVRKRREGVL